MSGTSGGGTTSNVFGKSLVKLVIASFLVGVVCLGIAMMTARLDRDLPNQAQHNDCNYRPPTTTSAPSGGQNAKPATATVNPPAATINFGGARGWQFFDVTVTAGSGLDRELPSRVLLTAPRRFDRENANLATVAPACTSRSTADRWTAPTVRIVMVEFAALRDEFPAVRVDIAHRSVTRPMPGRHGRLIATEVDRSEIWD